MAPPLVLLPGKSHGRRSPVGCSPWGREESDTTERFQFHFPLSCIGEGNGNPLQCSCLENPRDGGVWWASVYGVSQSRTRLERLSSSSNKNSKKDPKTLAEHWFLSLLHFLNDFNSSSDKNIFIILSPQRARVDFCCLSAKNNTKHNFCQHENLH